MIDDMRIIFSICNFPFHSLNIFETIFAFKFLFILAGSFMIVDSKTLKTTVLTKDRTEEISDIKFSPGMFCYNFND